MQKIIIEAHSHILGKSESELDDMVLEYLKNVKDRKLMSKQDKLAIYSACKAWSESKIEKNEAVNDRTGIYFCVGILPFIDNQLEKLATLSQKDSTFDEELFSTTGFNSMNPLLTFKCLPNMPLFHISYNLDITGRYLMTYPQHDDFVQALQRSVDDLIFKDVDYAIVGAACDQENILVKHHLKRLECDLDKKAQDCSASFVLSYRTPKAGDYYIEDIKSSYTAFDPLVSTTPYFGIENRDHYFGSSEIGISIIEKLLAQENEILIQKYGQTILIRRHQ